MMTDPIADMLTRIRNALMAGRDRVEFPASKVKAGVCKVLKDEGHIRSFKIIARGKGDVSLKVLFKKDGIKGIERVSRPGLRRYRGYGNVERAISGLGTNILSTSGGIISDRTAVVRKIGGEVLCRVW